MRFFRDPESQISIPEILDRDFLILARSKNPEIPVIYKERPFFDYVPISEKCPYQCLSCTIMFKNYSILNFKIQENMFYYI